MRKDQIEVGATLAVRNTRGSEVAKVRVIETDVPLGRTRVKAKGAKVEVVERHAFGRYPWLPFDGGQPQVGDEAVVANRNLYPWDEAAEKIIATVRERAQGEKRRKALEAKVGFSIERNGFRTVVVAMDDLEALAAKVGEA